MPTPVTGMGTSFNLLNYAGVLASASPTKTPFYTTIAGTTLGGGYQIQSQDFSTSVEYELPTAAQPAVSENDSVTAPAPVEVTREQMENVTQIFHESFALTDVKRSSMHQMSGLNVAHDNPNPPSEKDFQVNQKLKKIARDIEFTFLQGQYQKATSAAMPNKTRGMIELCSTGNTIATTGALTSALLNQLYKTMADNGASFDNMLIFVNSSIKQALTQVYASQVGFGLPPDRNYGGLNIMAFECDFFKGGIVYDPFMPQDTLLLADVEHIAPVYQPVPDKGNFYEEELGRTGAATQWQIFGQIGLDHGPQFLHGTITGIV